MVDVGEEREFFKVLLDGFDEKLRIPDKFVWESLLRGQEKVNLNSSIVGKVWTVEMRRHSNGLYFSGDGWREFVKDHDLRFGYFLVFTCHQNISFFVKPFDHSGCTKLYEPIDLEMKKKRNLFKIKMAPTYLKNGGCMHFPCGFRDSNDLSNVDEVTLTRSDGRCWGVKFRHTPRKNCSISSAFSTGWRAFKNENNLKKDDVCIFFLSSKDGNRANFFVIFKKRRKRDDSKVLGRTRNRKAGNIRVKTLSLPQFEATVKKPILQRSTTKRESKIPEELYFVVTLRRYNLLRNSQSYLNIPVSVNLSGIISVPQNIVLEDAKGRAWIARIYQNGYFQNQFRVRGSGWLQLAQDNTLEDGDVCKFKLIISKTEDHVLCLISKNNLI